MSVIAVLQIALCQLRFCYSLAYVPFDSWTNTVIVHGPQLPAPSSWTLSVNKQQ